MTNKMQAALELRKALQFFISTLDVDSQIDSILEIPTMFPKYKVGKHYKVKEVFQYGVNAVGDPQLYQVLQDHTSSEEWTPDTSVSLYKAIGITENGIPEWVQPLGATDAYMNGDVVFYNGKTWTSTCDNNVWSPDTYGWREGEV